jgi:hypothetical protein
MTTVPLDVLIRAVAAMDKSLEHMNQHLTPGAPYVAILSAKSELGWYVQDIAKKVQVEVEA